MNTAKIGMLCICLGAVTCSTAMMRRSGSQTLVTPGSRSRTPIMPGSRCQSPLSPASGSLSPVSPYSRSCLSITPVVPAVHVVMSPASSLKEQREEVMRQIDQKMCQLSCAQHAGWLVEDGDGCVRDFIEQTIRDIAELRKKLS